MSVQGLEFGIVERGARMQRVDGCDQRLLGGRPARRVGIASHGGADLSAHYEESQILEIMQLCGFYRTVSYLANALALPLEEKAVRFPR